MMVIGHWSWVIGAGLCPAVSVYQEAAKRFFLTVSRSYGLTWREAPKPKALYDL